jgi:hypothetical protein
VIAKIAENEIAVSTPRFLYFVRFQSTPVWVPSNVRYMMIDEPPNPTPGVSFSPLITPTTTTHFTQITARQTDLGAVLLAVATNLLGVDKITSGGAGGIRINGGRSARCG